MKPANQARPINTKVIIAAALLSVVGMLVFLQNYFILIAVSAILAYLFNPIYLWSLRKTGNRHGRAITITVVFLFAAFAIPITILMAITIDQAIKLLDQISTAASGSGSLSETVNTLIAELNTQADKLPFVEGEVINIDQVSQWLKDSASMIVSTTVDIIRSFAGGIANFFTTLVIFLFIFSSLLRHQSKIVSWLQEINPLGKHMTQVYLHKMGAMTSAMVKGQFAIAIMQGLSSTISLWIVGIDYLAFWFMLLTFLSIIPLGGGIILIPLGIILILTGNIWQGLLLLGWHFLITTNIDNVMRPKFVPKTARLDPALTILSVFAGISLFGFLGIIIGPVIMIILLTTLDMYLHYARGTALQSTTNASGSAVSTAAKTTHKKRSD